MQPPKSEKNWLFVLWVVAVFASPLVLGVIDVIFDTNLFGLVLVGSVLLFLLGLLILGLVISVKVILTGDWSNIFLLTLVLLVSLVFIGGSGAAGFYFQLEGWKSLPVFLGEGLGTLTLISGMSFLNEELAKLGKGVL
ncbi:hypothetical protein HY631_04895 [Candidatus Uhrbacteria bacterium]|nr:hypothetical protein [Candidatus Uhrbacteria bacterium]